MGRLIAKHFTELTARELHELYRLRVDVFVVEQKCPYPEIDDLDLVSRHVWLEDERGVTAYLRLIPPGARFADASIGRVLAVYRREGLGTRIVREGLKLAREAFGADAVTIEAQTYARGLYEKLGFIQTSEEFLEDDIPHIRMRVVF